MKNWCLAAILGLALAGCVAPGAVVVDRGELGPVPADYRARITAWAKEFFADPRSLRGVAISEPVPARDATGTLLWLVCLEADSRAVDGHYLGPKRFAFGFLKNGSLSAPLRRTPGSTLIEADCNRIPLAWSPWPALERL